MGRIHQKGPDDICDRPPPDSLPRRIEPPRYNNAFFHPCPSGRQGIQPSSEFSTSGRSIQPGPGLSGSTEDRKEPPSQAKRSNWGEGHLPPEPGPVFYRKSLPRFFCSISLPDQCSVAAKPPIRLFEEGCFSFPFPLKSGQSIKPQRGSSVAPT